MVFFPPSQGCTIPLFRRKIGDETVSISVDSAGYLLAVIQNSSCVYVASIQGVPNRVIDLTPDLIERVRVCLNEECMIRPCGGSILIIPKLRGGGPPIDVEDCKDNPQLLSEMGLLPLGYCTSAGLSFHSLLTGSVATGGAGLLIGLACSLIPYFYEEAKKYAEKKREVESLPTEEARLASVKQFFDEHLANDLLKVKGLDGILAEKVREVGKRDPSQLPQFLTMVAALYRYIDPKGGNCLLSISQELGTVITAGATLSTAGLPVAVYGGAIALILGAVVSAGWALKRYFFDDGDNPVVDSAMEILQSIVANLSQQQKEGFERIENTLGEMYSGLSQQLQATGECIKCIDSHLLVVESKIEATDQKIDESFIQLLGFRFREKKGTMMALVRAGIKEDQAKKYACIFLNWAKEQSKEALLTGAILQKNPPRVVLQKDDVAFHIGYLNSYLMEYFPDLAFDTVFNPLVWSEAAHAYMELRLSTRDFDNAYAKEHQEDFRAMAALGMSLRQSARKIQQSQALFEHLLKNYTDKISSLQKALRKTKSIDHRECRALLDEIDDAYALLRAFCRLAFSRSLKTDPYFISLLQCSPDHPHGLMQADDIKRYCRKHGVNTFSYISESVFETGSLLKRAFAHKSASIAKGETSDDSIVVEVTLQRLNAFWDTVYKQEDIIPQELKEVKPTHCLDISELCEGDLILGAKYGLVSSVRCLVERGTDIDGKDVPLPTKRTPLHYAALFGHEELVEYLLENGAAIKPDKWGKTPIDLAKTSRIQSLLIAHIEKEVPINALMAGKQLTKVCTSTDKLPGLNVYDMHAFDSRLVTVEHGGLQIWDTETGKCLKRIPRGPYAIRGHALVWTLSSSSSLCDLRSDTLRTVRLAEGVSDRVIIDTEGQQIINPKSSGSSLSILSSESGKVIDQINVGGSYRLCNFCQSSGKSEPSPYRFEEFLFPPFNGHPQCILIQKESAGKVVYEIWSLLTKRLVFSLSTGIATQPYRYGFPMISVAGQLAAVADSQGRVKVFDLTTNKVLHEVVSSNDQSGLFGLWNNKLVATVNNRTESRDYGIWDIESRELIHVYKDVSNNNNYSPTKCYGGFIKNGIFGVIDKPKNHIKIYDLENKQDLGTFPASGIFQRAKIEGDILILMATNSHQPVATKLSFFHIRTGKCLQEVPGGFEFCLQGDRFTTYDPQTLQMSIWKLL